MIIWRGWGILVIGVVAVCVGLGALLSQANENLMGPFTGVMLIGGGVGTWFLGTWLNKTRPVSEINEWRERRRNEIAAMVRGGAYNNVPDPQRPGQLADPWAVGEYVLNQEAARVQGSISNRHSLFFIPVQYFAFVLGAVGVIVIVVSLLPS